MYVLNSKIKESFRLNVILDNNQLMRATKKDLTNWEGYCDCGY